MLDIGTYDTLLREALVKCFHLVVVTNVTESVTDSVKSGRGGLAEILVLIGTAGGMLPPAECHRQPVLGSLLGPRGRISPNLVTESVTLVATH